MIDSPILKAADVEGLEGLLNVLLQNAEGLADFGEILDFKLGLFQTGGREGEGVFDCLLILDVPLIWVAFSPEIPLHTALFSTLILLGG